MTFKEYQYILPMRTVEEVAKLRNMAISTCVNENYDVVVYISQISRIKEKQFLSDVQGIGKTYREACIDFINNLMDNNFNIRYKNKFYLTDEVRSLINKINKEYLERGLGDVKM